MKTRSVILAAAIAAVATATLAQEAGEEVPVVDPVVAIVNGEALFASEIVLLYQSLGPEVARVAFSTLYAQLLEGSIQRRLVAARGAEEGLLDDPAVASRIRFWTERVIEEALVNRWVEEVLTDDLVRAAYDAMLADRMQVEEVRASHILVETQAEAYAAIERLEAGENFADLARELSIGPSGQNGGDLDYFQYEQVVPEFSDVAFALPVGEYTTEPVETQFGWHVILVTDRRDVEPPTYEEMYPQLRQQEGAKLVDQFYSELMEGVEVVRFNFDGTPLVGDEPAIAAPPAGAEASAEEAAPADGEPVEAEEPAEAGESSAADP